MTNPLSVFQHTPTGHVPAFLSLAATETAWAFHHTLPDYASTPLVPLRGWAQAMGVKAVFVKDESPRFGLNAFKGLGGIYALARAAGQVLGLPEDLTWAALQTEAARSALAQVEFVTATDGNHGRGVAALIDACARYYETTGRRISFEYAMIDGVNDTPEHAKLLAKHARRVCAHVNLIPLNHVEERAFRPSTPEHLKAFIRILEQAGVNVTVRRKLGSDVDASCGQLRKKVADHRA